MSSVKKLFKDKRVTVAGGLVALLIVSYLVGQFVVLPLRTEKKAGQEENISQGIAAYEDPDKQNIVGNQTVDNQSNILDGIEWINSKEVTDNPWGFSAGIIDTEEGKKAVFLMPGTAAKMNYHVAGAADVRLVYYVHSWTADVSDGLEFDLAVNEVNEKHLVISKEDVTKRQEFVLDLSAYQGQDVEISIIHTDENGGDLSGDWLVVEIDPEFVAGDVNNQNQTADNSQAADDKIAFELKEKKELPGSEIPFQVIHNISDPVILRGEENQWDSIDVLNPSVINWKGKYINYYSGFDGYSWRTGVAESSNGIEWNKYSDNPVFGIEDLKQENNGYIAANGSAVVYEDCVYYFYQMSDLDGESKIGLAVSENAYQFEDWGIVFSQGEAGTWDSNGVADPYVIYENGMFYLYYLGMNDAGIQRLGVAMSEDGIEWTRSLANPVLDVGCVGSFDENGLGEPSVYYNSPYFYMLYTGRNAAEQRNIGLAVSINGIDWRKISYQGEFQDQSLWNSEVICDTTFVNLDDEIVVYYGGGDRREPAENLDGQIGMFSVDLSQDRDMKSWDANADWSSSKVPSSDVLYGSYEVEGEDGNRSSWCNSVAAIELQNDAEKACVYLKGWIPVDFLHKKADVSEVEIKVYVNGIQKDSQIFTEDSIFEFTVDKDNAEEWLDIRVEANSSVVLADVGVSDDERALSYKMMLIEQR